MARIKTNTTGPDVGLAWDEMVFLLRTHIAKRGKRTEEWVVMNERHLAIQFGGKAKRALMQGLCLEHKEPDGSTVIWVNMHQTARQDTYRTEDAIEARKSLH